MRQLPITFGVLAVALLAAKASAQEANPTGFGIAFGLGTTTIEDQDGPDNRFDGEGFGTNLDIEWRFIRYLAIGMNFTSLGEDTDLFNGVDTKIEVRGFGVFVRGYLPVSPNFTLFARFGDTSYNANLDPGGSSFFTSSALDFGFGADYYFNDNLSLRGEARWLDGSRQEAGSITTLGVRWQF